MRKLHTSSDRRRFIKGAGAAALGTIASPFVGRIGSALAAWPDRPVKIVVANTPGGPSDILARMMAAVYQETLGGTFFIENKGGGGGNIGMTSVARADPDGYTLLVITSAYVANPTLFEKAPYDPYDDFIPISELATTPSVYTVDPDLGLKTMKDFIAAAKKEPDKFNVATPPVGTAAHIGHEALRIREGLQKTGMIIHTGGGQAMQALLSKTTQASLGALTPAMPHIQSGKILPLAFAAENRVASLPNVPTMIELGYKDFIFDTFLGLLAPAKTPPEIIAKLEQASVDALKRPDLRAKLEQAAFVVRGLGADGLKARIAKEVPMYKDIIESAGIKKKS